MSSPDKSFSETANNNNKGVVKPFRHYSKRYLKNVEQWLTATIESNKKAWGINAFTVKFVNAGDAVSKDQSLALSAHSKSAQSAVKANDKRANTKKKNTIADTSPATNWYALNLSERSDPALYFYETDNQLDHLAWDFLSIKPASVAKSPLVNRFSQHFLAEFLSELFECNESANVVEINNQSASPEKNSFWNNVKENTGTGWLEVNLKLSLESQTSYELILYVEPNLAEKITQWQMVDTETKLAVREHSIGAQMVDINAYFDDAELSIGEMKGLSVGDVLELNHSITEPLKLVIDQNTFAKGFLGKRDNIRMIQIET